MDPYSQDIYKLALDLISLFGLAAVPYLTRLASRYINHHLSSRQVAIAGDIARTAVHAAEALGANRSIGGSEKLTEALERAQDLAVQHNIDLSDEQWRTLLEAAVTQLKAAGQELSATPVEQAPVVGPVLPA